MRVLRCMALVAALGIWMAAGAAAQRVANTEHYIDARPADAPPYRLEPIYATSPFKRPQDLATDGMTNRIYVAQQNGQIWWFENTPNPGPPTLYLPARHAESQFVLEEGLEGLAFHPDFASNGYFYIYYVYRDSQRRAKIQRFQANPPDAATVSTATFTEIYSYSPVNYSHMGGGLRFGPDGYLYASYGDGLDFRMDAVNLSSPRGKILRFDVDQTSSRGNYAIPPDNPQAGHPTLPEMWAQGMRNPFRLNFDSATGELYVGDVGEGWREEISIVTRGAHMGWPYYEGEECYYYWFGNCGAYPRENYVCPVLSLPHENGPIIAASITGGVVYRGANFPEFYGGVMFGDYVYGTVGYFFHNGTENIRTEALIPSSGVGVSVIGEDPQHELLIADWYAGNIYRLERQEVPALGFPVLLSQAPWLIDLAKGGTAAGVLPYDVNSPLWSDGAGKTRFVALPGLATAQYRPDDGYDLPTSATLIKNFYLQTDEDDTGSRRVIETRLLVKHAAGWGGYSYKWDDAQADAVLVPPGGETREFVITGHGGATTRTQTWSYPSRVQCFNCHTNAQNVTLGLETAQLNGMMDYGAGPENQLEHWAAQGYLGAALPDAAANLPALVNPRDETAAVEDRARSYLHANCAMCHQQGGPTPVDMDLRHFVATEDMRAVGVGAAALPGTDGTADLDRVRAGIPERSAMMVRMAADGEDEYRMPPLARTEVDAEALEVVAAWIRGLSGSPSGTQGHWERYE